MEENLTRPAQPENKKKPSKAVFRFRRVCAVLLVLLLIWWFNNYTLRTTKVKVRSPKVTGSFRIAVISDLHATEYGISNKTILKRIKKASPDIVALIGDMYTTGSSRRLKQIPIDLAGDIIEAGYPVYFVPGEHDNDPRYMNNLSKAGVHVMDYKSEDLDLNGTNVTIYGIDNVYYSDTFDLSNEFTLDRSRYNILLAHIPNVEKFAQFGADLTICGDTHGYMTQLPFGLGPVYDTDTAEWFPQLRKGSSKVYDKGLFSYKDGKLFITSGIGASPFPIRFNNRPEVAVIDVVPEK